MMISFSPLGHFELAVGLANSPHQQENSVEAESPRLKKREM